MLLNCLEDSREFSNPVDGYKIRYVPDEGRVVSLLTPDSWAGTHFDWPRSSIHGSSRMCPGFVGSRSKPPDTGSEKLVFMSRTPRLALLETQRGTSLWFEPSSKGLDLSSGS